MCLCRIYVEESLRTNDSFTDQLEDDVADMQTIMGMGAREAADIRSEIVSKNYKCATCTIPCCGTCVHWIVTHATQEIVYRMYQTSLAAVSM